MVGVMLYEDYPLEKQLTFFEPYFFSYNQHADRFPDFEGYQIELIDENGKIHYQNPETLDDDGRRVAMQRFNKMMKNRGLSCSSDGNKFVTVICYFVESNDVNDENLNACHFVTGALSRQGVYDVMVGIIENWAKQNNRLVAVSTHWNQLVKGSTVDFT